MEESNQREKYLSSQAPNPYYYKTVSQISLLSTSFLYFSFSLIPQTYYREYRLMQNNGRTVKPKINGSRVFVLFYDIHSTRCTPGTQGV